MTASKRWRCYDAGRTSRFPLCWLASMPQLQPLNLLGLASTKSIPRLPTSVMRSKERTPSIRPSRDAYDTAPIARFANDGRFVALHCSLPWGAQTATRTFEGASAPQPGDESSYWRTRRIVTVPTGIFAPFLTNIGAVLMVIGMNALSLGQKSTRMLSR